MRLHRARIELLQEVQPGAFLMGLRAEGISQEARPGQFYMLRVGEETDPFLPRPFSWLRKVMESEDPSEADHRIQILFQVVGKATGRLARMHPGEEVQALGPLGRGWRWDSGRVPLLVGGGIGAASLISLLETFPAELRARTWALVGASEAEKLWCGQEMSRMGARVLMAVEQGGQGFRGTVVDLLREREAHVLNGSTEVFACGPRDMLREVVCWASRNNVPCQVSLETPMACGVGVCLGCAVRLSASGGYARACREGPVFRAEEIQWGEDNG